MTATNSPVCALDCAALRTRTESRAASARTRKTATSHAHHAGPPPDGSTRPACGRRAAARSDPRTAEETSRPQQADRATWAQSEGWRAM